MLLLSSTTVPASHAAVDEPEPKEHFELVHRALVDLSDRYVGDVMKTIAFLLLATGWILTSDRSREFLRRNRGARRTALITVPGIAILHVWLSIQTFEISTQKMQLLEEIGYFQKQYYAGDGVTLDVLVADLALTTFLFTTLFFLIRALRAGASPAPPC